MADHDPTPRAFTCRDFTTFVADYLDDALSADDRTAFEHHIATCPECVVYLASYRAAVRLARTHGADAPATELPEELVQAILAARRRGGA